MNNSPQSSFHDNEKVIVVVIIAIAALFATAAKTRRDYIQSHNRCAARATKRPKDQNQQRELMETLNRIGASVQSSPKPS